VSREGDFHVALHEGQRYRFPRVSSILRIIDRSAPLIGWATNLERAAMKLALQDVLTTPGHLDVQQVWDAMLTKMEGKRAHARERDRAAAIGTGAHELIRWQTLAMLGQDGLGPEPKVSDESLRAVDAWLDWARVVNFTPLYAELPLACPYCGVTGTADVIAKVHGVLTVVDYKTAPPPKDAKRLRVYPEALLQVGFYKHLARMRGIAVETTMVTRLPKLHGDAFDPEKDAVTGPEVPLRLLQGIVTTWRTMQWITGEDYGDAPVGPHPA